MDIPITWRICDIGGWTPDLNDGSGYDGTMPVGRVTFRTGGNYPDGIWWGSMFVTDLGKDRVRSSGLEKTRKAAKTAVMRCYLDLCAAHSDNRANAHAHHEQVRRSAEMWRGSRELGPVVDVAALTMATGRA